MGDRARIAELEAEVAALQRAADDELDALRVERAWLRALVDRLTPYTEGTRSDEGADG